jgi:hypothetical protein
MLRTTIITTAALMTFAAPALAQTTGAAPSAASPPNAAAPSPSAQKPSVGATVFDPQGGQVGTIASISGEVAVVDTGKNKAGVPLTSFAMGDKGPVMSMTKDQLDAAASGAKSSAAANVTAGAQVKDSAGVPLGTIKSVDSQYAVLDTTKSQVKLPLNAFAQGESGLVIGMTKAQLEAAAGGAGAK